MTLYNTGNYNDTLYNGVSEVQQRAGIDFGPFVFNDYDFDAKGWRVEFADYHKAPSRELQLVNVPRDHGQFLVNEYYRLKTIKLNFWITTETAEEMELKMDEIKKALSPAEGNLDIRQHGLIKRFIATWKNTDAWHTGKEHWNLTYQGGLTGEFICASPFGRDINYTSDVFPDRTELTFYEEANNQGTAPTKPIFILNFSEATNVSQVRVSNTTTGDSIRTNGVTITDNSYLRIDSERLEISLNDVNSIVDNKGIFPNLIAGGNSYKIEITGDSATYTLTTKFYNAYL